MSPIAVPKAIDIGKLPVVITSGSYDNVIVIGRPVGSATKAANAVTVAGAETVNEFPVAVKFESPSNDKPALPSNAVIV